MRVLIIAGTNLGNRRENLNRARELLTKFAGELLKESRVYQTKPFGVEAQPPFLNQGFLVDSLHPPHHLLKLVKWIEKRVGRYKTYRWGPRVIDLDLVWTEQVRVRTGELELPHRGLKDRDFFRKIAKELIPELVLLP